MLEIEQNRVMGAVDRAAYEKDGFVVVRSSVRDSQLESLRDEVERLHSNFSELKQQLPALILLGEWCIKHPHLASEEIRDYFFSNTFVDISRTLIGGDVDFYWATTAHKPPVRGKAFPWHQDAGYGKGPVQ